MTTRALLPLDLQNDIVLEDRCSSVSEEMHQFAIAKTLQMFARIAKSAEYQYQVT